ncbi:helix-turn-helix transcriptional regulator [Thioclava sp. 15-R06ZXC-3]|uniref:Helix-turn-helix transcriptional regulator n=1 Tax=Thioclava arctica TaxID=3238301 RepID=A0ABV3TQ38_9RHOB
MLKIDWIWGTAPPGTALAELRRTKGLTQAQLASRVGCSRPTLIALERAFTGCVATLLRVLAILGIRRPLRITNVRQGRSLAPAHDLVMTPPDLAATIIAHFANRVHGRVLDPARGGGGFFDRFSNYLERDWCELADGRNFLEWRAPVN